MKRFLLFLFLSFTVSLFAKNDLKSIKKSTSLKLKNLVKNHYQFFTLKNKLHFYSKQKLHFYVCVSLPHFPSNKAFFENVVKRSPKRVYEITFSLKKKWNSNKLKRIKKKNNLIQKLIYKLPKKYKLTHLMRTKTNSFFTEDKNEKKRVKKFEIHRDRLLRFKVRLPDFHTKKYSVFIDSNRYGYECVWMKNRYFPRNKIISILKKSE